MLLCSRFCRRHEPGTDGNTASAAAAAAQKPRAVSAPQCDMIYPASFGAAWRRVFLFCFEFSFGRLRRHKKGIRSRKEGLGNKQETVVVCRHAKRASPAQAAMLLSALFQRTGFINTDKYEQQRRPSNGSRAPLKCTHHTKGCSYGHGFVVRRTRRYKLLISLAGA